MTDKKKAYMKAYREKHKEDIKEYNKKYYKVYYEQHKEEIKELTSVIQQNTLVIQKLCDSLDQIQKGD